MMAASSSVGGWSPANLASVVAWYDFGDPTSLFSDAGISQVNANGQKIYQANDKSGHGNHILQTDGTYRPEYQINIQNGLSLARFFQESNRFMYRDVLWSGTSGYTVVMVTKPTANGVTSYLINNGKHNSSGSNMFVTAELAARYYTYIKVFSSTLPTNAFSILAVKLASSSTSSNTTAYLNGGVALGQQTAVDGPINISADGKFCINAQYTGTGYGIYSGQDACEIIVCDDDLATQNLNLAGNYLAEKWGLSWTNIS